MKPVRRVGFRVCPICGRMIQGRIDKKFCSDECRIYYNNARYRERHKVLSKSKVLEAICTNIVLIYKQNSRLLLKFILFISKLCKILSTFESFISKYFLHHDKDSFCIIIIAVCSSHLLC